MGPDGGRKAGSFPVTGPNPGQEHEPGFSLTPGARNAFADGPAMRPDGDGRQRCFGTASIPPCNMRDRLPESVYYTYK